jgi:hypothetical protein
MNWSTTLCQALVSVGSNISQDIRVSWVFPDELLELPELAVLEELLPHAATSGAATPAAATAAPPCKSFLRLTDDSNGLSFFGLSIVLPLLSEVRSYAVREYILRARLVLSRLGRRSNFCFFASSGCVVKCTEASGPG